MRTTINRKRTHLINILLTISVLCIVGIIVGFNNISYAEDETEIITIDNINCGDHIKMGTTAPYYTGYPYWRVLGFKDTDGDEKNDVALVISEYLWEGDGNSASAMIRFDNDGRPNNGQGKNNEWQNSDAQRWCKSFYNVTFSADEKQYIKGIAVVESQNIEIDNYGNSITFGPASLIQSDKVFFLSIAELKEFFNIKNGRPNADLVAHRHDGNSEGRAFSWWLRSPSSNSVGCVDNDGSINRVEAKASSDSIINCGRVRPAFYINVKSGIPKSMLVSTNNSNTGEDENDSENNNNQTNETNNTDQLNNNEQANKQIAKKPNTLIVKGKNVKIKYKKLKKKSQIIKRAKSIKISGERGGLTYSLANVKKAKFKKYFKVNKKSGNITVKKRLKKGKYYLIIKVTATGNNQYNAATKVAKIEIKIH